MAFNKLFVAVLLAAVIAVLAKPNDVTVGGRQPGDYLLQRENVKVPSKWLQIVKDTRTFSGNQYSNITQVRLLDQNKKGNGATAVVLNGGPGKNFVTVSFKSIRGHSIDFVVELYGK